MQSFDLIANPTCSTTSLYSSCLPDDGKNQFLLFSQNVYFLKPHSQEIAVATEERGADLLCVTTFTEPNE